FSSLFGVWAHVPPGPGDSRTQMQIRLIYKAFAISRAISVPAWGQFSSTGGQFPGCDHSLWTSIRLIPCTQRTWPSPCSPIGRAMKPVPDPEKHQMNGQGNKRWLIVVARGQADLYAHLVQAFSRD